jgi:transposase InsO family protein
LERLGGSLAIRVARRLGSQGEIEALAEVMVWRGIPEHLRSDNGTESIARDLRKWWGNLGTGTPYIEPGSPWENGYRESFNGKLTGRMPKSGNFLIAQGGAACAS